MTPEKSTLSEAMAHARAVLGDLHATGAELTRARLALYPFRCTPSGRPRRRVEELLQALGDARRRADYRDGLRPCGRPRAHLERLRTIHAGGPDNAA